MAHLHRVLDIPVENVVVAVHSRLESLELEELAVVGYSLDDSSSTNVPSNWTHSDDFYIGHSLNSGFDVHSDFCHDSLMVNAMANVCADYYESLVEIHRD